MFSIIGETVSHRELSRLPTGFATPPGASVEPLEPLVPAVTASVSDLLDSSEPVVDDWPMPRTSADPCLLAAPDGPARSLPELVELVGADEVDG